ncbi:hypothetical protein [Wolbachia sp. wLmal]
MPSSCHSSVKHCRLGWKPASRPGMTGFVIRVAPSVSSQSGMALLHRYL